MKLILLIPISVAVFLIQPGLIQTVHRPSMSPIRSRSSTRLPSPFGPLSSPLARARTSDLLSLSTVPGSITEKLRKIIPVEASYQRVAAMLFGDPANCQEKCSAKHGYYELADYDRLGQRKRIQYRLVTKGIIIERTCHCLLLAELYEQLIYNYGRKVADSFARKTLMDNGEEARKELASLTSKRKQVTPIVWLKEDDPLVQEYLKKQERVATFLAGNMPSRKGFRTMGEGDAYGQEESEAEAVGWINKAGIIRSGSGYKTLSPKTYEKRRYQNYGILPETDIDSDRECEEEDAARKEEPMQAPETKGVEPENMDGTIRTRNRQRAMHLSASKDRRYNKGHAQSPLPRRSAVPLV